jgi:hypothetical protein
MAPKDPSASNSQSHSHGHQWLALLGFEVVGGCHPVDSIDLSVTEGVTLFWLVRRLFGLTGDQV